MNLPEQYFMAVAQYGSFTRAAESLYVSQSSISKQVSNLEKQLGFPLLNRTTRSVSLTSSGEIIYRSLQKSMEGWENAVRAAYVASGQIETTLRIGMLYGWRISRFPGDGFERFAENFPAVDLMVEKYTYTELTSLLKEEALDLIVTIKEEVEGDDEIEFIKVFTDKLVLFLSSCHPLAGVRDVFPLLDGVRIYMMNEKSSLSTLTHISEYLQDNGLDMVVSPCPNFESIIMAVDRQQGCAITAHSSYICESPDYRYWDFGVEVEVVLAWKKGKKRRITDDFIQQFF